LSAVAASVLGLTWSAAGAAGEPERKEARKGKLKLSEIQAAKRAQRKAS
jgi:hypothetical protein